MTFCSNSRPLGDIVSSTLHLDLSMSVIPYVNQRDTALVQEGGLMDLQSISAGWGPAQALGITLGLQPSLTESPRWSWEPEAHLGLPSPPGALGTQVTLCMPGVGQVNPAHENGGSSPELSKVPHTASHARVQSIRTCLLHLSK